MFLEVGVASAGLALGRRRVRALAVVSKPSKGWDWGVASMASGVAGALVGVSGARTVH